MAYDPRWIYTRTGLDLTKAHPNSVQQVGGARARMPSLVMLPDAGSNPGQMSPTIVTTSSYNVLPDDELIIIVRDNPTTTDLNMRSVLLDPKRALAIVDWSTNINEHTIRLNAFAGQTVMKEAIWQLISSAAVRSSINLFPVADELAWMNAP